MFEYCFAEIVQTILGNELGVDWSICRTDEATGGLKMVGELKYATTSSIGDVISKFEEVTGCTWRIGKTGIPKVIERAVHFECVHRVPTHQRHKVTNFEVGQRYMNKEISDTFMCVRVDLDSKIVLLFNKTNDTFESVECNNTNYFRLGSSHKSFGCKAKLTFSKVLAGITVLEVTWNHNHDLHSFASSSRRDPAPFLKEWFAQEYSKGVPPMKALRSFIDHLFVHADDVGTRQIVQIMSDR